MKSLGFQKSAVIVTLAVVVLGGCTSGLQSGLVPADGASSVAARAANDAVPAGLRPDEKLCKPIVFTGIGWQYVNGTWYEWFGPWTYGAYNRLVPCAGDSLLWSGPIHFPWCPCWAALSPAINWASVKVVAVTQPFSSAVGILKSNAKATKLLETIDTSPYVPVDVAVSHSGTMYVSVMPPQNGSQLSGILVYPPGQTTPSEMLSDSSMGQNAGSIAVDKSGNLYVEFNVSGSGTSGARIDKFPAGSSKPQPFTSINDAQAGSLAVDAKGDVITSEIGTSASEIAIFNPKELQIGKFSTTPDPTSISLSNDNKQLIVSDGGGNLVTSYAYPNGGQQSQTSLGNASETWEPGTMSIKP